MAAPAVVGTRGLHSPFCRPYDVDLGKFRGGLDARKTCQFVHHEYYDRAYRDAHAVEFDRLFPLHNKCNAHFDLVPAWVNPSIMLCAALVLAAVAVPLRFGIACLTSFSRKEYQS